MLAPEAPRAVPVALDTRAAPTGEAESLPPLEVQQEASRTAEAESSAIPIQQGRLHGRATDELGIPLSGVRVALLDGDRSRSVAEAISDEGGRFHMDGVARVTDVRATLQGYALLHATDPAPALAEPWKELHVVLAGTGLVRVTALDAHGSPLPGLAIEVFPRPEEFCEPDGSRSTALGRFPTATGTTDENGLAVIEGVWTGVKLECLLSLESAESPWMYKSDRQDGGTLVLEPGRPGAPILAPSAGVLDLRVAWEREFRLSGAVVWPDGRPAGPSAVYFADLGRGVQASKDPIHVAQSPDGRFDVLLREHYFAGSLEIKAVLRQGGQPAQVILRGDGKEGLGVYQSEATSRMVFEPRSMIEERELRLELHQAPANWISLRVLEADMTPIDGEYGFLVLGNERSETLAPNVVQVSRGPTLLLGLPTMPTDVFVWLPRTASTPSARFHTFRGIPAWSSDVELRLPATSAVRVRVRPTQERSQFWTLVEAHLPAAPKPNEVGMRASTLSRPWPEGLLASGAKRRRDEDVSGVSLTFVELEPLQDGAVLLELGDPGWYRIGLAARSENGRTFAARATDLTWFDAGEHELVYELVPTGSVKGQLQATGDREFLGLALVEEASAPVSSGTIHAANQQTSAIPVATHGRFHLTSVPVGHVRLRVGTMEELAIGRYRCEVELEIVEGETSTIVVRL